eukprot:NODE_3329_length_1240_cov_49.981200_g3161_i0.p1 GENE.NODE_3329_length_1240_cov_49.981200_g3161_i0~~NODE_3329_length_1240_cov_49.981200_g3161_i0.p1  ORF type:complete len:351 (+),score=46.72 NODE_3329_length_1240_cov_49.981200_g3161_i0:55-1107(+)
MSFARAFRSAPSSLRKQLRCATTLTVRDALNTALDGEFARDPKVYIMGEEVGIYNGAYKVTKGLYDKWGARRVIDTPITESGFTGIAVGSALAGLRPICEFMTFNFSMQAIDHVVNSAAKVRYMSGGQCECPIVFRGPNGAAAGVGAQHSQCFAAWYSSVPGLKVLSPWNSEDAIGLLRAAIRDDNPVVFLENEMMYGEVFDVRDECLDPEWVLPIGKAHVQRAGKDVTIACFGRMVGVAMKAAEELAGMGIDCEVLNLRTLRPLDRDSILDSVSKTHRLLAVEEGWVQCGIASEVITTVVESEAFEYLDSAPMRVTGADVPMPYAKELEAGSLPNAANIVNSVRRMMGK